MSKAKLTNELSIRNRWSGSMHPLNAYIRKDTSDYKTSEVEFRIEKFQQSGPRSSI